MQNTAIAPVAAGAHAGSLAVAASQALTPLGSLYQITPSPTTLSSPALLSIAFNPGGVNLTSVSIYRYNGTAWDAAPVTGETLTLNSNGTETISGYLGTFSLYGVFSKRPDVLAPRTALDAGAPSFSSGTILYAAAQTTFTLTAVDDLTVVGDSAGVVAAEDLAG